MKERLKPLCGVTAAGCVKVERLITVGRVERAVIASERASTAGRVEVALGVEIERLKTDGRVVEAVCEVEERRIALSRVIIGIATIGRRNDRSRHW